MYCHKKKILKIGFALLLKFKSECFRMSLTYDGLGSIEGGICVHQLWMFSAKIILKEHISLHIKRFTVISCAGSFTTFIFKVLGGHAPYSHCSSTPVRTLLLKNALYEHSCARMQCSMKL